MAFGATPCRVVIPAQAGIHAAVTKDERAVAGIGVEIPCSTAWTGSLYHGPLNAGMTA